MFGVGFNIPESPSDLIKCNYSYSDIISKVGAVEEDTVDIVVRNA